MEGRAVKNIFSKELETMIFNNIFLSKLFFPFLLYFLIDVFHFVFYKNTFQSSDFLKRPYFFEATRRFLWKFYFIYFSERNFCAKHTYSPSFINKRWKCAISFISFERARALILSQGYRIIELMVLIEMTRYLMLGRRKRRLFCQLPAIQNTFSLLWNICDNFHNRGEKGNYFVQERK